MSGFRVIVQDVNYQVPPGETLIGRSDACAIVVKHSSVSRLHAALRLTDKGLLIEDLGSRNGTAVNGKRLDGPRWLAAGDVIILGQMVVDVIKDDTPTESVPPASLTSPKDVIDQEPATEKVTADAMKRFIEHLGSKKKQEEDDSA